MDLQNEELNHIFEEEPVIDDIENFIVNSEITEEEILRVIQVLKEDKSAGTDGIALGLFYILCCAIATNIAQTFN